MGRAHEVRKVAMAKTAAVKSKLYAKFGKEIYMAAKSGVPDPDANQSLKRIIERAKKEQVSADVIKRAIDKAKGGSTESYDDVRYEAFGPGDSLIIVECLTDNVNRTYTDIRTIFNKTGGKLGNPNTVAFQFNHYAVITVLNVTEDEILDVLLSADINVVDYESDSESVTVYGDATDLTIIKDALLASNPNYEIDTEEITWLAKNEVELDSDKLERFERLLAALDEVDDVQDVYHNVILSDDEDEE
jgi:YebC/PmpR family DNA-binding regulatory protein